jgi:hypothetical protein
MDEIQQDENGVYNMYVESGHWLFKICKNKECSHIRGRHQGPVTEKTTCFDCECKGFIK